MDSLADVTLFGHLRTLAADAWRDVFGGGSDDVHNAIDRDAE